MTHLAPSLAGTGFALVLTTCAALGSNALTGGGDATGTGPVITGAQIIAGPVAITGDTSDNTDQFDVGPLTSPPTDCGASAAPDTWYTIAIGATTGTINIDIDLCTTASGGGGTVYDSKIFVLDAMNNPLQCNDETGCTTPGPGPSAILNLQLVPGTYELAIDGGGAANDSGIYAGEIRLYTPPSCFLDFTQPCGKCTPEGEVCDMTFPDNFNGGCNSTPEAFSHTVIDEWACGTVWGDNGMRDTDWWSFNNPTHQAYQLEIEAEVDTVVFIARMTDGGTCPVLSIPAGDPAFSGECDTIHISELGNYVLIPGDYVMFVGTGQPNGNGVFDGFPCPDGTTTNNAYRVRLLDPSFPPPPCPWDLSPDTQCKGGTVGFEDILEILAHWGPCPTSP